MNINFRQYGWIGWLLLLSCEGEDIYYKTIQLAQQQWPMTTVLDFPFQVKDVSKEYDFYLWVKYTGAYPYQNLCVTYSLEDNTSQLLDEELKNFPLFFKTGKPLGSGLGSSKSHAFLIKKNHQFSRSGNHTLKLVHFMRTDMLPGLQSIGIKITPSKLTPYESK